MPSLMYGFCSSTDGRTLELVPGLEPCSATEFRLLFTLVPGVGDPGFAVPPLTMPFSVGICDDVPEDVPSEERMSREAGGNAFGLGFFAPLFLKRNDILRGWSCACRRSGRGREDEEVEKLFRIRLSAKSARSKGRRQRARAHPTASCDGINSFG